MSVALAIVAVFGVGVKLIARAVFCSRKALTSAFSVLVRGGQVGHDVGRLADAVVLEHRRDSGGDGRPGRLPPAGETRRPGRGWAYAHRPGRGRGAEGGGRWKCREFPTNRKAAGPGTPRRRRARPPSGPRCKT